MLYVVILATVIIAGIAGAGVIAVNSITDTSAADSKSSQINNLRNSEYINAYFDGTDIHLENRGKATSEIIMMRFYNDEGEEVRRINLPDGTGRVFGSGVPATFSSHELTFDDSELSPRVPKVLTIPIHDTTHSGEIVTKYGNVIPIRDMQYGNDGDGIGDGDGQSMIDGMGITSRIISKEYGDNTMMIHGKNATGQVESVVPYIHVSGDSKYAAFVGANDEKEIIPIPLFGQKYIYNDNDSSLFVNNPNILSFESSEITSGDIPNVVNRNSKVSIDGNGIFVLKPTTRGDVLLSTNVHDNENFKIVTSDVDLASLYSILSTPSTFSDDGLFYVDVAPETFPSEHSFHNTFFSANVNGIRCKESVARFNINSTPLYVPFMTPDMVKRVDWVLKYDGQTGSIAMPSVTIYDHKTNSTSYILHYSDLQRPSYVTPTSYVKSSGIYMDSGGSLRINLATLAKDSSEDGFVDLICHIRSAISTNSFAGNSGISGLESSARLVVDSESYTLQHTFTGNTLVQPVFITDNTYFVFNSSGTKPIEISASEYRGDREITVASDDWSYSGTPGYSLSDHNNMKRISGNSYRVTPYAEATLNVPVDADSVTLSFDWRAFSRHSSSVVTNFNLKILDTLGNELDSQTFGGRYDTGIKSYSKDITSIISGHQSIIVRMGLNDIWSGNYAQQIWWDDVTLLSTFSEPATPNLFLKVSGLEQNIPYQIMVENSPIVSGLTSDSGEILVNSNDGVSSLDLNTEGTLVIYPESTSYRGSFSTVIMDPLNDATLHIDTPEDIIYTVHAYGSIPVISDVQIKNARISGGEGDNINTLALPFLNGNFTSSDTLNVPILPKFDTIHMQINGVDISLSFSNIINTAKIRVISSESSTIRITSPDAELPSASSSVGATAIIIATAHGMMDAIVSEKISGSVFIENKYSFDTVETIPPPPPPRPRDPLSGWLEVYVDGELRGEPILLGINESPNFTPSSDSDTRTTSAGTRSTGLTITTYHSGTQSVLYEYPDFLVTGSVSVDVEPGDMVEFYLYSKIFGEIDESIPRGNNWKESGQSVSTAIIKSGSILTSQR